MAKPERILLLYDLQGTIHVILDEELNAPHIFPSVDAAMRCAADHIGCQASSQVYCFNFDTGEVTDL